MRRPHFCASPLGWAAICFFLRAIDEHPNKARTPWLCEAQAMSSNVDLMITSQDLHRHGQTRKCSIQRTQRHRHQAPANFGSLRGLFFSEPNDNLSLQSPETKVREIALTRQPLWRHPSRSQQLRRCWVRQTVHGFPLTGVKTTNRKCIPSSSAATEMEHRAISVCIELWPHKWIGCFRWGWRTSERCAPSSGYIFRKSPALQTWYPSDLQTDKAHTNLETLTTANISARTPVFRTGWSGKSFWQRKNYFGDKKQAFVFMFSEFCQTLPFYRAYPDCGQSLPFHHKEYMFFAVALVPESAKASLKMTLTFCWPSRQKAWHWMNIPLTYFW